MWGWLPGRCCLGRCMGLGRPGLLLAEGLGGRPCLVGLFSRVGLACLVRHERHACRASASCLCGEWGVVGASACVGVACCRGSGAVRPGCLTCLGLLVVGGFGWVWVGWL